MNPDFWTHLVNMWLYGISTVFLMFTGYKLIDLLTPKINFAKELVENKNIAVGIMVASIFLSMAAIIVAVLVS